MTKAERYARRYLELERRAKEIQAKADNDIKQLSTEWPRLDLKNAAFEVSRQGTLVPAFDKSIRDMTPEEALQLAYWIIDTFEEGEA